MNHIDNRFRKYYETEKYKGFYKLRENKYKLSGQVSMVFTNGHKQIMATGLFQEAALAKIFDRIDSLCKKEFNKEVNQESKV